MAIKDEPADLQITVQALGLNCIERHIIICADASKPKCVDREASIESWDYLKKRLQELQLTQPQTANPSCIFRTKANCLRVCQQGPILVVYPDGVWYHSATPEVIEKIIQDHIINNQVVSAYAFVQQPLSGHFHQRQSN